MTSAGKTHVLADGEGFQGGLKKHTSAQLTKRKIAARLLATCKLQYLGRYHNFGLIFTGEGFHRLDALQLYKGNFDRFCPFLDVEAKCSARKHLLFDN